MSDWISIDDRLPDMGFPCLGINSKENSNIPDIIYRINTDERWRWVEFYSDNFCDNISHWMPLPEPPE